MTRGRAAVFDLHGLPISLEVEGLDAFADRELLPAILRELPPSPGPSRIAIRLVEGAASLEAGARPLFFHGRTRVLGAGDRFLVTDGRSVLEVRRDGAAIDGRVDPGSLDDRYSFAHTTVFIALVLALRAHGRFHLHAGGLIAPGGAGILVVGEGGAGKTSTTLSLLEGGAATVGDDALFVAERDGRPVLLAVPKRFHVGDRTIAAFGLGEHELGPRYRANNDKRELDPERRWPGRSRPEMGPPALIVFPEIEDRAETAIEPLDAADVFGRLTLASALVVVEGMADAPRHLGLLARLVDGAAGCRLALGRDALADPTRVGRALLARLRAP